jgi:toxin ParE1/3/4
MAILRFAPTPRQDLQGIFDYTARDKPDAAARWIDKIEGKCALLADNPELGEKRPELGEGIRSSLLGRYIIFYRAVARGIEIVRVIAGDRDIRHI